jgi:hypothetical protein
MSLFNIECIDPNIRNLIVGLNDKGLKTSHSCAGIGPKASYSGEITSKIHEAFDFPYIAFDCDSIDAEKAFDIYKRLVEYGEEEIVPWSAMIELNRYKLLGKLPAGERYAIFCIEMKNFYYQNFSCTGANFARQVDDFLNFANKNNKPKFVLRCDVLFSKHLQLTLLENPKDKKDIVNFVYRFKKKWVKKLEEILL